MKNKPHVCAICGSPTVAATMHDFMMIGGKPVAIRVCHVHLVLWVLRRLAPEDVLKLRDEFGETYSTHDDFYDTKGRSLQPI